MNSLAARFRRLLRARGGEPLEDAAQRRARGETVQPADVASWLVMQAEPGLRGLLAQLESVTVPGDASAPNSALCGA